MEKKLDFRMRLPDEAPEKPINVEEERSKAGRLRQVLARIEDAYMDVRGDNGEKIESELFNKLNGLYSAFDKSFLNQFSERQRMALESSWDLISIASESFKESGKIEFSRNRIVLTQLRSAMALIEMVWELQPYKKVDESKG